MHQVVLYITTIFDIKKQVALMNIKITKREFILFFASKYNPLELINQFVVSFKCLFQKVCISKVNFDAILPPNILKVWHNILTWRALWVNSFITSHIQVSSFTHKTNVNPKIGIARKEGTTLSHVIMQVHSELSSFIHISSAHCWCDSMIILRGLNSDGKKQKVFVRRMVEEVHK